MEKLTTQIMDFYDSMLDGQGVAKMLRVGMAKNIPARKIRMAAKLVYDRYMNKEIQVSPLTIAKEVYRVAKSEIVDELHKAEYEVAKATDELLLRIQELENIIANQSKPFWKKIIDWSCYA